MTTLDKLEFLKHKFVECAVVQDAKKGYIFSNQFNVAIDPDILEFASRCWAERYHYDTHIDAIAGLPDAGARLISILAQMLRVRAILPSKRAHIVPGSWKNVVSYSNRSFTMNEDDVQSHIGFVKSGMRVLLVDDVIAHGDTAIAAIHALQNSGVEVIGLAVLFDKVWQCGIEKIKQETGIDAFSLIRIKEITADGNIHIQ